MARLYLDEDVAAPLGQMLRGYGHFVTDAHTEQQEEQPDPSQLLYAAEQGLTLVGYNGRDFQILQKAWGIWTHAWRLPHRHAGIIMLPNLRPDFLPQVAREVDDLLTRPDTMLENALYELSKVGGVWRRNPR